MNVLSDAHIDRRIFRDVLGHFPSGIVVVTATSDGEPVGLTCQSFISVSLEPPLVAFSPAKSSVSYPRIRLAGAFCINVLAEDHAAACAGFARSGQEKWRDVRWSHAPGGSPVLPQALVWLECHRYAEHEAGDHYLMLGQVTAMSARPTAGRPLLYYKGAYARLEPPAPQPDL
jgi:3-hydroxy-9,10-secoandrosta-1,3,5(10)-triene-9,17-dione monooxygenase reductase component